MSHDLSWLHCNECHRSFEHHNRLDSASRVIKSDLKYSFTACGHFFCENCIDNQTIGGQFNCSICGREAECFDVDKGVPEGLEIYVKSPIGLLEDSISVMNFQLNNSKNLIKSLRCKVSQQKDIITKAKQELSSQKLLKQKLAELAEENECLKKKFQDISRVTGGGGSQTMPHSSNLRAKERGDQQPMPPNSPIPAIERDERLSLRSPFRAATPKTAHVPRINNFPFIKGNRVTPSAPTASPFYNHNRNPTNDQSRNYRDNYQYSSNNKRSSSATHQQIHRTNALLKTPTHSHLAQPIYAQSLTPENKMNALPHRTPRQSYPSLPPSPRQFQRNINDMGRNRNAFY